MGTRRDQQIDELIAIMEIDKILNDYMRGQDRLDAKLHRSVFWDDCTLDYGFYQGGPDGFVEYAQNALSSHTSNHHMIGQKDIRVEGDVAFGEIYYQAWHCIADEDGNKVDFVCGGRYVDRYEKRFGMWKFAHRTEIFDWARTDPASDLYFERQPSAIRGKRGKDDISSDREALRTR
jgi:hypothetical protein